MAYSFSVTRKPNYLHVIVTGENTPEHVRRYLSEVAAACTRYQCWRVLIEENLSGPSLPVAEVFFLAAEGSRSVAPGVNRIAYVDVNPEHDRGTLDFAETVAVNRGVNVKRFAKVEDAEIWINQV